MRPRRTTIAAGATLLGLGALAAAAVTAGGETAQPDAAGGSVEVRTQVIHRTQRERPARPQQSAAGGRSAQQGAAPRIASREDDAEHGDDVREHGDSEHGDDAREHGDDTSERGDDTESEHGDRRGGSHSNRGRGRDD